MYNIETKGYDANEKVIICNDYLIPRLEKELNMEKGSIQINEQRIKHMVEKYTNEEKCSRPVDETEKVCKILERTKYKKSNTSC